MSVATASSSGTRATGLASRRGSSSRVRALDEGLRTRTKVPYYLLIVGSPEAIPYTFQYGLDVQYAVGRICFDQLEDYASYADGVVAAETRGTTRSRRVTLFAPCNPDDPATALSAAELVKPLARQLSEDATGWGTQTLLGEAATKARLAQAMGGGEEGPALLFSATHGVAYPNGDPHQLRRQGALLCQEWPGPDMFGQALDEAWYFSADDLSVDARVAGLISFHFACFGAGTPRWDDFARGEDPARRQLAPHAFVAALPQRLLSHPNGGALAAIGHVDRAWGCSFVEPEAGQQTEVYASCVKHLMSGNPIGSAFEYFNQRYAELSTELTDALSEIKFGKRPDHRALAAIWMANNDARDFVVLGDPAVRLVAAPVADADASLPPEVVTIAAEMPPPTEHESGQDIEPAAVDFGVRDGLRQARERLVGTLQSLAESLGGVLERAVDNVTVLNVATYSSDDLAAATWDTATRQFAGATLHAVSRIAIDGDTQLLVREDRPEIDAALWTVHLGMVEQARLARAELLKTASSAFAGLLDAAKAW